jgi:phage terminase large subunit-like protein
MAGRTDETIARAVAKKAGWDPLWIRDVQDVRAVLEGCWFDAGAGDHVVEFFTRYLHHSKGRWAGQPFHLLPWEEDLLRRLFGWKRADGTRRYRRGGVWIPKKNGKSTLCAGIELYMLVGDSEEGAEVYTAANDRSQAGLIYTEAANMVRKSAALRQRLQPIDSRKTIAFPATGSMLQALSADVPTKEGLNASAIIIDELHAQRTRALWDTLLYAGAARRQPLNLTISTAGIYDQTAIGWQQYDYARQVASGRLIDTSFLAVIYEASAEDDWTNPAVWKKANPSFGATLDPQTFAEECQAAQQSPPLQNNFRRYRLNQWVQQATRAIDLTVWDENAGHDEPMREAAAAGRTCDAGLDLSSVSDLTSFVALFPCETDPEAVDVFARFWVPQAQLLNQKNPNRELYQQWADEEWLTVTPGNAVEYEFIIAQLLTDAAAFHVRDLSIDRLFQGQHVFNKLTEEGVNAYPMGQGYQSFGPPMREFHRRLLSRTLHHGNHPILRWMADNVITTSDAHGNEKIDKPKTSLKVDGIVSLVMALDRVTRHATDEGEGATAYDDDGIFVL